MRQSPKTCLPNTAEVCPRPRVTALLDAAMQTACTYVTASAGSGKTSLVAAHLHARPNAHVWLTIDPDDKDPATFFHYLSRAAQGAARKVSPPLLTPDYKDGLAAFARRYAREVFAALPDDCTLVFDTFESVGANSPLHEVLATFVRELHAGQHIIITSRLAPPQPFAALRVAGSVTVIDETSLRFSVDETEALARARLGDDADRPSAQRLTDWAQGWAAGLVLGLEHPSTIADALPAGEAPQVVFDYFAAEVFGELSEDERAFLLRTAVFRRFNTKMAEGIVPGVGAAQLLEGLLAKNFFVVRLAGKKGKASYAYHRLFRAFLLRRGDETLAAADRLALYRSAAEVLVEADDVEQAVSLLLSCGDWTTLDELICAHAEHWLTLGLHNRVVEAATFPAGVAMSVELRFWRGTAQLSIDPLAARDDLVKALDGFIAAGDVERMYLCAASVMESILWSWRGFAQLDHWMEMIEHLLTQTRKPSFKTMGRIGGVMYSAQLFRRLGDEKAGRWEKEAKRLLLLARVLAPSDYILLVNAVLMHELFAGNFPKAKSLLDSVANLRTSKRVDPIAKVAYYVMASAYSQFAGEWAQCLATAQEGLALAEDCGVHFWDNILRAQGAGGALHTGRADIARAFADDLAAGAAPDDHFCRLFREDILNQLALDEGDTAAAVAHAQLSVEHSEAFGSRYVAATMRVALTHALSRDGQADAAHKQMYLAEQEAVRCGCGPLVARCALLEAEIALARGYRDVGEAALRRGFSLCRDIGLHALPWWRPRQMAVLCGHALALDIETEYVRDLIRRQNLVAPEAHRAIWPGAVQIYVLGRYEVVIDGQPLRSSGKSQKRPLELLAALVALGGRTVPEDRVAAALWPDADGDAAQQSVKTTVHRLRKLLGPDVVHRSEGKLSLDPAVWVDALVAQEAFASSGQGAEVAYALSLYQGRLLPELEEVYLLAPRQGLQDAYCRAVLRESEAKATPDAAQDLLETAIERAPSAEALYAALIQLHLSEGRRAQAADTFRACELAMRMHFDAEPSFDLDTLPAPTATSASV